MNKVIRLNRALSMLGICSRRDADKLIQSGQVFVNNNPVVELGAKIRQNDKIKVFDKEYNLNHKGKTKVWLYYKPIGLVTTHKDELGRRTVFDEIHTKITERVISVGRLDINSEGLLLLTNDSKFAKHAESPQTGWKRHYKVRVFGDITDDMMAQIRRGISIDGIKYAPMEVAVLRETSGKNRWLKCILTEGKNREIRKIFEHFGLSVNRLIRTQYGDYSLNDMKPGDVIMATPKVKLSREDISYCSA
ncbi:MAG: rRNA pseudouridine synthase [Alphaproteobacteria bacterium]|nr:rRNA pseudouridine synthase [Alphaproteobacteria bacterium]MBQ3944567.1 rRNA pseudouridine synthase [Alphaproteobacteria bacterium]